MCMFWKYLNTNYSTYKVYTFYVNVKTASKTTDYFNDIILKQTALFLPDRSIHKNNNTKQDIQTGMVTLIIKENVTLKKRNIEGK